jgi:transposase
MSRRTEIIEKTLNGELTIPEAAVILKVSVGTISCLKRKARNNGIESVDLHGNKGRTPPNKISEEIKKQILDLKLSDKCKKMNGTEYFHYIQSEYNITYNCTTVRRILKEAGIIFPKPGRPRPRVEKLIKIEKNHINIPVLKNWIDIIDDQIKYQNDKMTDLKCIINTIRPLLSISDPDFDTIDKIVIKIKKISRQMLSSIRRNKIISIIHNFKLLDEYNNKI